MPARKRPRRGAAREATDLTQSDNDNEQKHSPINGQNDGNISTSPYFEKKRRSEEASSMTRRAAAHARVAHSRAAHFARAPVSSSCPTGVLGGQSQHGAAAEESWPGPFSTAHDMIKKREAAKQAREAIIAEKDRKQGATSSSGLPDGDVYDQLLQTIASSPRIAVPLTIFSRQKSISRLSSLATTTLATYWEFVEELGNLSATTLAALGSELSRQRKLTPAAVRLMYPISDRTGKTAEDMDMFEEEDNNYLAPHRAILLSDCSALDEECIYDLLTASAPQLESLELINCGHVLTSYLVERLTKRDVASLRDDYENSSFPKLHTLTLTGIYRLQDAYLTKLFALLPSRRVRSLNLSKDSCLAHDGIAAILQCGKFSHLTTLNLDSTLCQGASVVVDVTCAGDDDEAEKEVADGSPRHQENAVTMFCRSHHEALPHLTSLSLKGVTSLTDSDVALLLSPSSNFSRRQQRGSSSDPVLVDIGQRLQTLHLDGCSLLTDRALATVRTHCRALRSLDLSNLPLLTTPALMGLFLQEKYVPPLEAFSSPELHSGIATPTAVSRSIGPLCHLSLSGLSRSVTDDVLQEACTLSASAGSGLRTVNLSRCSQISDKTLACLAHHCAHSLEQIDLSFTPNITLPVVLYLLGVCMATGKLTQVSMWGCSQLRRAVVELQAEEKEVQMEEAGAGNVLDQLRQLMNNSSTENGKHSRSDDVGSYPSITGFLDV